MTTGLAVGSKAPAFKLPRDGGDTVSLADFKGRKLAMMLEAYGAWGKNPCLERLTWG